MRLKGKKVVLLAENNYEDLELWVPYYRLKEEGAVVTIVGTGSSQTYTSKHGYPVQVNKEAKEIDVSQYDGVVIPGGYAPDLMRRYPEMVRMVREASQKGKVIAAICHAGWMLVSAGILRGKKRRAFSRSKMTWSTPEPAMWIRRLSETGIWSLPESPTICPLSAGKSSRL